MIRVDTENVIWERIMASSNHFEINKKFFQSFLTLYSLKGYL